MVRQIFLMNLALITILWANSVGGAENTGPRIEVKEMQHNFGKVVQGATVSYVFNVRNIGDEPLVIERVVPS